MKSGFNHKKVTQCLNFFASREGGPIVNMKALKLLWLADRLHLRRYGRTISDDTYYALRRGPVATHAANIAAHEIPYLSPEVTEYSERFVAKKSKRSFESVAPVDEKVFSQTDRDALRDVYSEFGSMNEEELSELSHHYPEWQAFEQQLAKAPQTRYKMSYEDFFRNAENSNRLFAQDAELLELSQEMFTNAW